MKLPRRITKAETKSDLLPGRFLADEDGSATVEACIWIPVYLLFLFFVFDATIIFAANANIQRVVQDASRQFVTGTFGTSTSELETWIEAAIEDIAPNAVATATIDGSGILAAQVSYPASDTDLTGATSLFSGLTVRTLAFQQTEN